MPDSLYAWLHVPGYVAALSIPIVLLGGGLLLILIYAVGRGVRSYHRDGVDWSPEEEGGKPADSVPVYGTHFGPRRGAGE